MYLIGIDVGTTNLKVCVYDLDGKRVSSASRPTLLHNPDPQHPAWAVYEPVEIWNNIAEALREAVGAIPDPEAIKGIAITSMGEAGIPVDKDGSHLYPAIAWFDPRAEPQTRKIEESIGRYDLFRITGHPIYPIYSINKIMWFKENVPDLFAKTVKWLCMEDYIIFKLTGEYATDYSVAGRTMAFDVKKGAWSEEIFKSIGIDSNIMPPAHPSATPVGEVTQKAANETGLKPGTMVATGGHDHSCGALAVGVFEEGSVLDSTGTAEALITVLNSPLLGDDVCDRAISVYHHPAPDRYQALGAIYFSGGALDWIIDRLGMGKVGAQTYAEVMSRAESAEAGSNGLFYLPHLRGSFNDPYARGGYIGLLSSHTQEDILRATIEGLCYELKDFVESYKTLFKLDIHKIVAIGGATASDFWMQTKADVSGCLIEVSDVDEATSLGAAVLAGVAAGVYRDHHQAYERTHSVSKVFEPEGARNHLYTESYRNVYRKLSLTLKEINHTISRSF